MSVNQHGKIVGQVIRPGVAAPDRKQKRLPTARPQPPTPTAQDIIEISSDEDEDPQPPPKRVLTKRGRHSSPQESDYKAFLSQRDHEIEMLKKVRHQPLTCGRIHLTLDFAEGERAGTNRRVSEEGNRDKGHSCVSNP